MPPLRILVPALLALAACSVGVERTASSPPVTAEEALVRAHVDALNRGDLEAFMAGYAPDAVHLRHPADTVFAGAARIRRYYGELFADAPALRVEVLRRIVSPPFVIDHARVTGLPEQPPQVEVVVYRVVDGRIRSALFLH